MKPDELKRRAGELARLVELSLGTHAIWLASDPEQGRAHANDLLAILRAVANGDVVWRDGLPRVLQIAEPSEFR